jgi:DNA-binding MarR family transcriptional regulator
MVEEPRIPSDLDATEREFLIMLLPGPVSEKLMGKQLTTEKLNGPPLTRRLRSLAKRGLVAHIPAPHGSLWCLTRAGREIAQALWNEPHLQSQSGDVMTYSTGQALQQQDAIISEEAQ